MTQYTIRPAIETKKYAGIEIFLLSTGHNICRVVSYIGIEALHIVRDLEMTTDTLPTVIMYVLL